MSGIDKAAEAFVTDMGGSNPSSSSDDAPEIMTVDDFFNHEHEDDVVAGGDNEPTAEERRAANDADDEDEDLEGQDDDQDDEDLEDEDEDEDDEDTVAAFDDTEFEVLVDGQPKKVNGKEMREGYIRTETFHQRLNKLHDAGRQMEVVATQLYTERDKLIERLSEAEQIIEALVPAEPNWDELFAADPARARSQQKTYDNIKAKLADIKAKKEAAIGESKEQSSTRYTNWVQAEQQRTLANNPSWRDPQKGEANMQRDLKAMADTAKALGFSEEEIKNTHDSRMLAVLMKAAKYDRIAAKRPKVVRNGKPKDHGAGRTRTAPKGADRPQRLVANNGNSIDQAANVFGNLLQQEKRTKRRR